MSKLGDECELNLENIVIAPVVDDDSFSEFVAETLGIERDIYSIFDPATFTGGEFGGKFQNPEGDIEGKTVYIISTTDAWKLTPQERAKRIEMTAKNAKQHGAKRIIIIATDHPYTRQERVFEGELRSLRDQAENFKFKGADEVLTIHVHSDTTYCVYGEVFFEKEIESEVREKLFDEFPEIEKAFLTQGNGKSLVDFLDFARPGKVKIVKNKEGDEVKVYEKKEYFDRENESLMDKVNEFYKIYNSITREYGKKVFHSLNPAPLVAHYLLNESIVGENIKDRGNNISFVYVDGGARPFGESVKKHMELAGLDKIEEIQIKKYRESPNDPDKVTAEIDEENSTYTSFNGKYLIFVDDGTETAGTLQKAVMAVNDLAKERGETPAGIIIYFTHAWFNGKDYHQPQKRLIAANPTETITTNTNTSIEHKRRGLFKKRNVILRLAKYVAAAIKYGFEQGRDPEEVFTFNTKVDLDKVEGLYVIKTNRERYYRNKGHRTD